ncbi:MAG: hypothetical protein ACE5F1_08910, partial [Planctomycetota bacterium]
MQDRIQARLGRPERGNAMVVMLAVIMTIGSLAAAMLIRSVGGEQAMNRNIVDSRLLMVAEAGLGHNYVRMEQDALYAVKDPAFGWDPATQEYVSPGMALATQGGDLVQQFRYRIQYLDQGVPVEFTNRVTPAEAYDGMRVTCTARTPNSTRTTAAWYSYELTSNLQAAIASDATPRGTGSGGKNTAVRGHVVFFGNGRTDQHVLYGDIKANAGVYGGPLGNALLTETNAPANMLAHSGTFEYDLAGTADEIPNFTALGGPDQLFDFLRFEAAARLTGTLYTSLTAFVADMNAANSAGVPLQGIIVVKVDPALEGIDPEILPNGARGPGIHLVPRGINIQGTLAYMFANGTDPMYKIIVDIAVNINAADLRNLDLLDETTFTSGFPGRITDPSKMPWLVDITPAFENFTQPEDLPALMFDNSVVDLHGPTNICGVIYGPSFIEIENKNPSQLQYVNGAIFAGSGVYLEANGSPNSQQAFRFDTNVMDTIKTRQATARELV